jgi:hypothetical protein
MKTRHRSVGREFKTDPKETHWGKRKLKRDQLRRPARSLFAQTFRAAIVCWFIGSTPLDLLLWDAVTLNHFAGIKDLS